MRATSRILTSLCLACAMAVSASLVRADDEEVFSGPQEGEKLADFKVLDVLEDEGKTFSIIKEAKGGPVFIIFVHKVTRPSIGLLRQVMNYAADKKKDGLTSGVVFLTEDVTQMQAQVKRMSNALPKDVHLGISPDKQEGPGAYGLNRNVTLTVLVGAKDRVTANFAIVQPSIQADAIKILEKVVKTVGKGEPPKLADLLLINVKDEKLKTPLAKLMDRKAEDRDPKKLISQLDEYIKKNPASKRQIAGIVGRMGMMARDSQYEEEVQRAFRRWSQMRRQPAARPNPRQGAAMSDDLRGLLRGIIQKEASKEDVDKAVAELETHLKKTPTDGQHLARIANTIINANRLENYGTPYAQEIIKSWPKKYGSDEKKKPQPKR